MIPDFVIYMGLSQISLASYYFQVPSLNEENLALLFSGLGVISFTRMSFIYIGEILQ